ncbi:MAG: serine hydrolase domain-containing protein [Akkermansia sp.]|nr:serine hydrolase domain-containing protein [Akkermansia sp.]
MKQKLQQAFELNLKEGLEQGGAVSVWQNGTELCTLCGGESRNGVSWQDDTLVPIYSATKPAAAACLLQALHDCCRGPELAVGDLWPRFPMPHLTVGQLLSHQSGLAALAEPAPIDDLDACRRAIERSTPLWGPPQHGYHPQTFGPLVDILLLELTGQRVSDYWEERVRRPLALAFYIGHVPENAYPRVAELRTARMLGAMPRTPFYREYFDESSAVHRAFHSIDGYGSAREMNTPQAWQCGSPAKGGIASARGLSMFYQALMGHLPGSPFAAEVAEWMSLPQCRGMDLTLLEPTAFTCGAMCEPASLFGEDGFGHAGAGGSLGLCRPTTGLSFAYVMRGMELGNLPGERVHRLLRALP